MALLEAALEHPVEERAAFIASSTNGDVELQREVVTLLSMESDAASFLETPAVAALADVAGRRIGPYQIVREIGRGGMGTVYLAGRDDVKRRVALKLVRGGLAAPERIERFLIERRVLARLEHVNIARMLDAGVADDGTPWFAMELIEGEALDHYCDAHLLTVSERLRLVEQVCEAVAYAHRNLIVHRDLKPNNILVTSSGEVKLLDFGIAKLLDEDSNNDKGAGLTEAGLRLLTPEYAAPEQVRGEPVTTATDVYALGVILYELLAGTRPQRDASASGTMSAPRPPRRLSSVIGAGDSSAAIALARSTTTIRLRRRVAGDLDTIVGKALEADADRRYASAAELLEDLRRHRTGFPVRARPASRAYRARAFVRRNRWGVAVAAGVLLLLVGTAGVTLVQEARTRRALARATAEATKASAVTRFIASLLQDADPFRSAGKGGASSGGVGELLNIGADRLERELGGQPEVRVELLRTLAEVQRNLGRYPEADTLLMRAIVAHRAVTARPDADVARLEMELGKVRRAESDTRGADTLLTQALSLYAALGDSSPGHAMARFELGSVRQMQSRPVEAESLFTEALRGQSGVPEAAAATLGALAALRSSAGDVKGSEKLRRDAVAVLERAFGPDHPRVGRALEGLAGILGSRRKLPEAEQTARRALDIERRHLPEGHPDALTTASTLSLILVAEGKLEEAERLQRETLEGRRRLLGDSSRDVAGSLYVLAVTRRQRGDLAEANELLMRSLATYDRVGGGRDPDSGPVLNELAITEHQRHHDDDALRFVARVRGLTRGEVWDAEAQDLAMLGDLVRYSGEDCRGAILMYDRAIAVHRSHHAIDSDPHLDSIRTSIVECQPRR